MAQITKEEIRQYMEDPKIVKLMKAATDVGLPAVEPLASGLFREFGQGVRQNPTIKKMIGRVGREIMECHRYVVDKKEIPTPGSRVFTKATRYKKKRRKASP